MATESRDLSLAELIDFRWHRLSAPSVVDRAAGRWPGQDVVVGEPSEQYSPLRDEPALFRKFALLEESEDALLGFAAQYGYLGFMQGGVSSYGEYLSGWRRERLAMAGAVRLFDALKSGTAPSVIGSDVLTRAVVGMTGVYLPDDLSVWLGHINVETLIPGVEGTMIPPENDPVAVVPRDSSERLVVQTALAFLVRYSMTHYSVTPSITSDGKVYGAGLRLTFEPKTLIGALWLQLAFAIDGNREYAKCTECATWWDKTGARRDKETCSDTCRAKKSQRLRSEAAKLRGGSDDNK